MNNNKRVAENNNFENTSKKIKLMANNIVYYKTTPETKIYCTAFELDYPKIDNLTFYWDEADEFVIRDYLNNNKEFFIKKYLLERGDLFIFSDDHKNRYRNNGVLIWNGEKFLCLESDLDEYGHIPKEFLTFQEFPLDYFQIAHNHICHTDISKLNTVETVITINVDNMYCKNGEKLFCNTFIFDGKEYKIGSKFSLKNETIISFDYAGYECLENVFDFVVKTKEKHKPDDHLLDSPPAWLKYSI